MRAAFIAFFAFFTTIFNGANEYASAFEASGRYVNKATQGYVDVLEREQLQRLAAMDKE